MHTTHQVSLQVDLFADIAVELVRARTQFPGNAVMGLALLEEAGELSRALREESAARVREEAIQVAVMAIRIVLDGDSSVDTVRRIHGLDALPGAPVHDES